MDVLSKAILVIAFLVMIKKLGRGQGKVGPVATVENYVGL